jgi:hypothetical protein
LRQDAGVLGGAPAAAAGKAGGEPSRARRARAAGGRASKLAAIKEHRQRLALAYKHALPQSVASDAPNTQHSAEKMEASARLQAERSLIHQGRDIFDASRTLCAQMKTAQEEILSKRHMTRAEINASRRLALGEEEARAQQGC